MSTVAIKRHWTRVAALDCIICRGEAEIAHCHGGSLLDRGILHAKGKKLPRMDWLVLPLCPIHHRAEYGGLDGNVREWERFFGKQTAHLDQLGTVLGLDLWALAGETRSYERAL